MSFRDLDSTSTRGELRAFWRRLLGDMKRGKSISNDRSRTAVELAASWAT